MKKWILVSVLGMMIIGLLGGCAASPATADDNPYHLEQGGEQVHGEASVLYGHSAGR